LTREILAAGAKGKEKFCDHFHIPLQSGSGAVLKAMRRRYTPREYKAKIEETRSFFPNAGVYADVIAGFPSETEENFLETVAFIKELGLAGLHVFSFSARPFTDAAKMPQLAPSEIKRRAVVLRRLDAELRESFALKQKGGTLRVLWESYSEKEGGAQGVAGNFQRVVLPGAENKSGLEDVLVIECKKGLCYGQAR
jgi:threonylcarbamoyladenosine tRNA methylthiotransferase MtaB